MAKPNARKSRQRNQDNKPAQTPAEAPVKDAQEATLSEAPAVEVAQNSEPFPGGMGLVEDLQKRCEALRTWHEQSQAAVTARETELVAEAEALHQDRVKLEAEQREVIESREQVQADRDACHALRAELDGEAESLHDERAKLDRTRHELDDQRVELKKLRSELDEEWASLTRIRRAQEALADALDADRERIASQTLSIQPIKKAA